MSVALESQFSELLTNVADTLDISKTRYEEAEARYNAVGSWLGADDSPLARYKPEIYPHGSFRLGTVVRPVSHADEYDVDLVCLLNISETEIDQRKLKIMIGERLKANKTYAQMLGKEDRRCWTLHYADDAKFNMDILPAIPGDSATLTRHGVPYELAKDAINITDKTLDTWLLTNPKGYAEWFKAQMRIIFDERKRFLAAESRVDIEDIPDNAIKTPLQRAIQILKRHRNIMFENDPNGKTSSIVITTLAAKAYNNEADLYQTLLTIVDGIPNNIETIGGNSWVRNPVNPSENLAEEWQDYPDREMKFRTWLRKVKVDLQKAIDRPGIQRVAEELEPVLGKKAVNEAAKLFGQAYKSRRDGGALYMASGTGTLGTTGNTKVEKHTFYGS